MSAACLLNRFLLKELIFDELSEKNWELLIRQAKSANLAASLAEQVLGRSIQVPDKAVLHLCSERLLTSRQVGATQYEFEKLAKVFLPQNIKAILLKGAAYIALDLDFAKHRKLSDIDILVDETCISKAEKELIFYGWVPQQVDDYDKVYYREWMHEIPPLIHRQRGSVIDLHHNIFPPISGISPNSSLLMEQAVYLEEFGLWRLSNEDMFIHSAVHFFLQSETQNGLRDLSDMNELFRLFSLEDTFFPFKVIDRASKLNLSEPVLLALRYMKKIFGIQYSENFQQANTAMSPGFIRLKWLDFLYLGILVPHHPGCMNWHFKLAKFFVFWRGHIKKMPLHILLFHMSKKSFKHVTDLFKQNPTDVN